LATVGGGVELEIHCPHHVGPDRRERADLDTDPDEALLATPLRHPQTLFAPQSADTFVVDVPASPARHLGGTTPPPTGSLRRELAKPGA